MIRPLNLDSQCPDANQLSAWADGVSTPAEATELASHVEVCVACQAAFAVLANGQREGEAVTTPSPLFREAPLQPVAPVRVGDVLLGKYEVIDVLGAGGMGIVVRAKHLQLNTMVAMKFIRPELAHDADVVSRFAREARAASRLKSPHANRVLDFEKLPSGEAFMVMEYLEGETLEHRLARSGPLDEREVALLMGQALDALSEAHALGIVHRDLKPANLFLQRRPDGSQSLSVLDFGVAKSVNPDIEHGLQQTTLRGLVGSPAYMAPEQVTPGAPIDLRADLWAVGCTMHTLLAGQPPFRGGDLVELAWAIRTNEPSALPATVSRAMRACVQRCLRRPPAERFSSASELRAVLTEVAELELRPQAPKRRLLLVVAAVLGAGVFAAVGLARQTSTPPPPALAPASASVAPPAQVSPVVEPAPPAPPPAPLSEVERPAAPAPAAKRAPKLPLSTAPKQVTPPSARDASVEDVFENRL
jgi:serine/threonine-protein kinase